MPEFSNHGFWGADLALRIWLWIAQLCALSLKPRRTSLAQGLLGSTQLRDIYTPFQMAQRRKAAAAKAMAAKAVSHRPAASTACCKETEIKRTAARSPIGRTASAGYCAREPLFGSLYPPLFNSRDERPQREILRSAPIAYSARKGSCSLLSALSQSDYRQSGGADYRAMRRAACLRTSSPKRASMF